MEYYFYIVEREKEEKRIIDAKLASKGGGSNQVNVPTILPESVTTKINKKISFEDLEEIKRKKREKKRFNK
jgi:hypothetical protein